jgi:flagellar motor switch protein FliN/FliY
MVRDIQVSLSVELGRTDMIIQDILEPTAGKVIELDRLAGEPLDILVNGKLLAKGEVVVVDENFGVRITAIVDAKARENALGNEAPVPAKAAG